MHHEHRRLRSACGAQDKMRRQVWRCARSLRGDELRLLNNRGCIDDIRRRKSYAERRLDFGGKRRRSEGIAAELKEIVGDPDCVYAEDVSAR